MQQKVDPPALMLAGKRAEGPVMRNGESKQTVPVDGNNNASPQVPVEDASRNLDTCSTAERKLQQRMAALESANLVRCARADFRARLSNGELDFDEFLDETPECCETVAIGDVLRWLPGIGPIGSRKILAKMTLKHGAATPVSDLDQVSKYDLSAYVHERAEYYWNSVRGQRRLALAS